MSARKQVTPFIFVAVSFVLGVVVLATASMIIKSFEGESAGVGAPTLAEFKTDDGSTITLHAVTFGQHHHMDVSVIRGGTVIVFETGYIDRSLDFQTGDDAMVVWLSRKTAAGTPMDCDWWSHCLIADVHGTEVRDGDARRHILQGWPFEQDDAPNGRPFQPRHVAHSYYDSEKKLVIATGVFPKIRSNGDISIRVFDVAQKQVAEFKVPNPAPQPTKEWTAQTLPIEQTVDQVTLRLTELQATVQKEDYPDGNERQERMHVQPNFAILDSQGKPSADYSVNSIQFFDSMENVCHPYDLRLSLKEPAWRLEAEVLRRDSAAFTQDEVVEIGPIEIPARDTSVALSQEFSNGKIQFRPLQIGGRGSVTYGFATRSYGNGSIQSSSEFHPSNVRYDFRVVSQNRTATVTLTGNVAHLRVENRALAAGEMLTLLGVDDQGRDVPIRQQSSHDTHFWILNVADDAKSVKVKAILQTAKRFTFFVKPPTVFETNK